MPALPRRVAAATALLLTLGAAPALADTTGTGGSVPFSGATRTAKPARILPQEVHGAGRASTALGSNLTAVARHNGLTPARLEQVLATDETAWISETGQMFYREELPAAADGRPAGPAPAPRSRRRTPPARPSPCTAGPGASKQIFLDFDGVDLVDTGWNTMPKNPIRPAPTPATTATATPTRFSAAEHAWIQEVWRQVAETYAPFDVDVTTADAARGARHRVDARRHDVRHPGAVHQLHLRGRSRPAPRSCLGVAYVGTFGDLDPAGYYQPAWVFTKHHDVADHRRAGRRPRGRPHAGPAPTTAPPTAPHAGLLRRHPAWGPVMGSATSGRSASSARASTPAPTTPRTTSR